MSAIRVFMRLRELLDVLVASPADGDVLTYETASSKWKNLPAAGGGAQPFNGCRYQMVDIDNGYITLHVGNGTWIGQFITDTTPHYDTDSYASAGFSGGYSNDGYLHAPADGYYRIGASVRVNFANAGSDATYVECIISSPDRDGEWDDDDHFTVHPGPAAYGSNGMAVTHWLAAGDRIYVSAADFDGSVPPKATAALEMEFVGSGTNPAP